MKLITYLTCLLSFSSANTKAGRKDEGTLRPITRDEMNNKRTKCRAEHGKVGGQRWRDGDKVAEQEEEEDEGDEQIQAMLWGSST